MWPLKNKSPPQAVITPSLIPWLIASGGVTALPHLSYLPVWLASIVVLLFSWRLWLWHRALPCPPRWLLMPVMLLATIGIVFEHRTLFGQEAGISLLALYMGGKLLELRAPRDGHVVVMLGLFLLLTHYFNAESIGVGAWMLLGLTVVVATMIQAQAPGKSARSSVIDAARMIAQAIPLMIILFVLFPRISGPLWGLQQESRKASTGLSEEMSPGSISELIQSGALAFRVRFDDRPPEKDKQYWRGPVLTDFDGRNWRRTPFSALPFRDPPAVENDKSPAVVSYEMTLEPHNQRWLLALDLPIDINVPHGITRDLTAMHRQVVKDRLRYRARAITSYRAGVGEADAVRQRNLRLPAGNARARELAAEWRALDSRPERVVAQALAHFRNDAFFYTLRPPLLPESDGIDAFLFSTRRGFCEHYAGSFVFLMRAAGIPARVVTGYQGGEMNPVDGYFTVRQSDAHAWAEVWLADKGWVRIDPTAAVAPSRVEQGLSAALAADEALPALMRDNFNWLRDLRFRWEAVNNAWNQWVLGYDAERQRQFLQRFGLDGDWRTLIATLVAVAGLTLLAIAFWLLQGRFEPDPTVRYWRRLINRLSRLGIAPPEWEGPRTYSARASKARPDLSATIDLAAAAFERLHYGTPRPEDLRTLKTCLKRLPRRRLWQTHAFPGHSTGLS